MTRLALQELEARRLALQEELDSTRDRAARNRIGQYATPTSLALDMLRYAKAHLPAPSGVRFVDPALGTGAFYSALLREFPESSIEQAVGYEIDPHYGEPARSLWGERGLSVRVEDFTRASAPAQRFNLLICNPPYVRHHHLGSSEKLRLRNRTQVAAGLRFSGLAGLYCYFLGLSHTWVEAGGLAGWLIPSEFMDVNYGRAVRKYLLESVTLLHIHRFDPTEVQFDDALVSSAVVWFRKAPPPPGHLVRFSYGGTLERPRLSRTLSVAALATDSKWTRQLSSGRGPRTIPGPVLSDFFRIKRGLVTGSNRYFILPAHEIDCRGLGREPFRPILPSPRFLTESEVRGDEQGNPIVERRLFLLDPPWNEGEIERSHPKLWAYLEEGRRAGVPSRYLCRHRRPWYRQESRPPAPFLCTYLGRTASNGRRPFRFILNHSDATAANVYLMLYPERGVAKALTQRPGLKRDIWECLNQIPVPNILGEGRVYGGGLHKLEPKELGRVPADDINAILPESARRPRDRQPSLFTGMPKTREARPRS